MRRLYIFLLACCGIGGLQGLAMADVCNTGVNLVANCAFQSGDFTGWNLSGSDVPTEAGLLYGVEGVDPVDGISPVAGSADQAFFADLNSNPTTLSQSLATTAGSMYEITFYLAQDTAPVVPYSNSFAASFGGTTLLSLTGIAPEPYTEYSYVLTASGASTNLSFTMGNDLGEFLLDDISVEAVSAVPEPSEWPLLLIACMVSGLAARRTLGRTGR